MEMSNKVSKMLFQPLNPKCALCWIVALLAYDIDLTSCLVSFTEQVFLLGNSG